MQEIIFIEKKENRLYAKRDSEGIFELIESPHKGDKVFEFAVVAGG